MPPDDFLGPEDGAPVESEATGSPAPEPDPEAPYGYRLDGTPKTSNRGRPPSGRKQPSGAAKRRAARERQSGGSGAPPPPPRARTGGSGGGAGARRRGRVDYATGLNGILQLVAFPLYMAGGPAGQLDACALMYHGPGLVAGLDEAAQHDPRLAAVLERILAAGPYGALMLPVVALAGQIAVNHGALPAELGRMVGALPPDVLIRAVNFGPPAGVPDPGPEPAGAAPAAA